MRQEFPRQRLPAAASGLSFLGAGTDIKEARVTLLGAPMDWTTSHRPGARLGPRRVREAAESLEEFSLRQGTSLEDVAFCDLGDLVLPHGNVERSLSVIQEAVGVLAGEGKIPFLVGGEHLVTLGAVRAMAAVHPALVVIQLDAHADLRDCYRGERYSHATVMRRVTEVVGGRNVYQVGIRSATAGELAFARETTHFFTGDLSDGLRRALADAGQRPVYVTLDIDVVDPAFAPGTGNPEPGGPSSGEVIEALYLLGGLRVVGLDVVEVCPPQDPSDVTSVLAAKMLREAIILLAGGQAGQRRAGS